MKVTPHKFRQIVASALDDLPPDFHRLMKNVDVVVEAEPAPELRTRFQGLLLGLYQGVPLNRRNHVGMQFPDKISIYQRNIERICSTELEIHDQVKKTVLHEIGHHFGLSEREIRDAGY